jgi:hypothetical protein
MTAGEWEKAVAKNNETAVGKIKAPKSPRTKAPPSISNVPASIEIAKTLKTPKYEGTIAEAAEVAKKTKTVIGAGEKGSGIQVPKNLKGSGIKVPANLKGGGIKVPSSLSGGGIKIPKGISKLGKIGVAVALLSAFASANAEASGQTDENGQPPKPKNYQDIGVGVLKHASLPIASILSSEFLGHQGGVLGKIANTGSKSIGLGKQIGAGIGLDLAGLALDAFVPTNYKKENNAFQKTQDNIENVLDYASYVPIPAVGLATSTAKLGIKTGNRIYDKNLLGLGTAADTLGGTLYGVKTNDRKAEERERFEDEKNANLSPFEFKRKSIKDSLDRAYKLKTEYSSPDFLKNLSGYQKGGIDREIDKQNTSIEKLTKQLEDLERNGIIVKQGEAAQAKDQEQATSIPIKIEISIKDADKLPDIFNAKIVKPLEEQLRLLSGRTTNVEEAVGIGPQPAEL